MADTREFSVEVEVKTPDLGALAPWLPSGRFSIAYHRASEKRAASFAQAIEEGTGQGPEALAQRIEEGDAFGEVFRSATGQALRTDDPGVHDLLARLVAEAFSDSATIDIASLALRAIEPLSAAHIRVLIAVAEDMIIHKEAYRSERDESRTRMAVLIGVHACRIEEGGVVSDLLDDLVTSRLLVPQEVHVSSAARHLVSVAARRRNGT